MNIYNNPSPIFSHAFDELYFNTQGHSFYILEKDVLREKGKTYHRVRFINSGYETIAQLGNIKRGKVKDQMEPRIHGVGYLGADPRSFPHTQAEYNLWADMLGRVYGNNPRNRSYKGTVICSRWFCFKNFCEDIRSLPNYDKWAINKGWNLDKDGGSKKFGFSIYSPHTCQFITAVDNMELMRWSKKIKSYLRRAVDIRELNTKTENN